MREIMYKNLTIAERRKKDFWICETLENDNIIARTQRRCIYKIKEQIKIENIPDVNKWLLQHGQNKSPTCLKKFLIYKRSDSRTGEEMFICKVVGNLFAVTSGYIFSIAFMHIIKITLINLSNKKYKQNITG